MKERAERQTAKSFFKAAVCPLLSRGDEKETDFGDGRKSFKSYSTLPLIIRQLHLRHHTRVPFQKIESLFISTA